MGDVVNLRQARKARALADAAARADGNRARHGRTKTERLRDEQEAARRAALLDGAKREPDEDG